MLRAIASRVITQKERGRQSVKVPVLQESLVLADLNRSTMNVTPALKATKLTGKCVTVHARNVRRGHTVAKNYQIRLVILVHQVHTTIGRGNRSAKDAVHPESTKTK